MVPRWTERKKIQIPFYSFTFKRTVCTENGAGILVIPLGATASCAKENPGPESLSSLAITDLWLYSPPEYMPHHQRLWWQDKDLVRLGRWWVPSGLYWEEGLSARGEHSTQLLVTVAGWSPRKRSVIRQVCV